MSASSSKKKMGIEIFATQGCGHEIKDNNFKETQTVYCCFHIIIIIIIISFIAICSSCNILAESIYYCMYHFICQDRKYFDN